MTGGFFTLVLPEHILVAEVKNMCNGWFFIIIVLWLLFGNECGNCGNNTVSNGCDCGCDNDYDTARDCGCNNVTVVRSGNNGCGCH